MPTVTVAGLQNVNNQAVLKFQVGALLMGDASAALLTTPFDNTGALQAFPAGYQSGGYVTTDGLSVGRAITISEVNAWQSVQPVRADVTADKLTAKVKFNETNPVTLALQDGLTLAAVNMASAGFYTAVRDSQGRQPQRRVILIAEDYARQVIMVRSLPNAILTAVNSDAAYQRDTELQYDYQLDAYPDVSLVDADGNPTDSQVWFGGPGWAALSAAVSVPAAWAATTAYSLGTHVKLTGGAVLNATTAGTSGSSSPTPPSIGSTVTDGTVVWTRLS